MFKFLKNLFSMNDETMKLAGIQLEQAPYKIEPPEVTVCKCGRSPTGVCTGLHMLANTEWNIHPDNPCKAQQIDDPVAAITMQTGTADTKKKPALITGNSEKTTTKPSGRKPKLKP